MRGGIPPPPEAERAIRADADRIVRAALRAVDPEPLVEAAVRETGLGGGHPSGTGGGPPRAGGDPPRLAGEDAAGPAPAGRLVLLAVGKAALPMTRGALRALHPDRDGGGPDPERVSRGLVLVPEGSPEPDPPLPFPVHRGGHPLPTEAGLRGARAALELVRSLERGEHLLLLLSGGGSALLTFPEEGLSLEDLRDTTDLLLKAGASIGELNAVRKHLERLKGGRLALEAAEPPEGGRRPVTALVISDVVGSPPEVIASGPVSPDPSTYADALDVLDRHGLRERVPRAALAHLVRGARGELPETPKPDDERLAEVDYRIVADVTTAMGGAEEEARGAGYRPLVLTPALQGEARTAGRRLGGLACSLLGRRNPPGEGICLIAGGETTVRVRGPGRGGRNQELALGAAVEIDGEEGLLLASVGTDGVDGPTDAAGALATGSTVFRARSGGMDPEAALAANDSHPFFDALGDLIRTGPTGTNVMDVQLVLAARPRGL